MLAPLVHLLSWLLSKGGTLELPADVANETAMTKVGPELKLDTCYLLGLGDVGKFTWLVSVNNRRHKVFQRGRMLQKVADG